MPSRGEGPPGVGGGGGDPVRAVAGPAGRKASLAAAAALAVVVASGLGCGKKGSPVPPAPQAAQTPAPQEGPQPEKKPPEVEERLRKQPLLPP